MTATQTRDPLPGAYTATVATCPTCGPQTLTYSHDGASPYTRSLEPQPDGRYVIQPHSDWCPVWTGEQPRVAAPCCGAPVAGYDVTWAYWLAVPGIGPNGQPVKEHVLSTETADDRHGAFTSRRVRAPEFDKATLSPCGHTIEGDNVHAVLAAAGDAERDARWEAAEQTLVEHAVLLDRATAAGQGVLVDQYREAVRHGRDSAAGLLVALRTLAG